MGYEIPPDPLPQSPLPWGLTEGYFLGVVIGILIVVMIVTIVCLISVIDATVEVKKSRFRVEEVREKRLCVEAEERMKVKSDAVGKNEEATKSDSTLD